MIRSASFSMAAAIFLSVYAKAARFSDFPEHQQSMILTEIATAISQGAEPLVVYSPPDGWMRHDGTTTPGMAPVLGLTLFYKLESFSLTATTTTTETETVPVYFYPSGSVDLIRNDTTGQVISFAMVPTDDQMRLVLAKHVTDVDKRFIMKPARNYTMPFQNILEDAKRMSSNSFAEKYNLSNLIKHYVFRPFPKCVFALEVPHPEIPAISIPDGNKKILSAMETNRSRNSDGKSLLSLSKEELSDLLYLALDRRTGPLQRDSEYQSVYKRNPDALALIQNGNLLSDFGNRLSVLLEPGGTKGSSGSPKESLEEAAALAASGRNAEALSVLDVLSRNPETKFHASLLRAFCLSRQGKNREACVSFRSIEAENGWRYLHSYVFPDDVKRRHICFGPIANSPDLLDEAFIEKLLLAPCVFILRFERGATGESGRWVLKKEDEELFSIANADISNHTSCRFLLLPGMFRLEYVPREGSPRQWQINMPEWGYVEKRLRIPVWVPKMDSELE